MWVASSNSTYNSNESTMFRHDCSTKHRLARAELGNGHCYLVGLCGERRHKLDFIMEVEAVWNCLWRP